MMLVVTIIQKSPVHGYGLFAATNLLKGQPLFRFMPPDTRMPLAESDDVDKHYGYVCPRTPEWLSVCADHARFWNFHNDGSPPNAIEGPIEPNGEAIIVAARDIAAGEELLIDRASDMDATRKLSA
jgi:SET domain-containing protein